MKHEVVLWVHQGGVWGRTQRKGSLETSELDCKTLKVKLRRQFTAYFGGTDTMVYSGLSEQSSLRRLARQKCRSLLSPTFLL